MTFQKRRFIVWSQQFPGKTVKKSEVEALTLSGARVLFKKKNPNAILIDIQRFGRGQKTPLLKPSNHNMQNLCERFASWQKQTQATPSGQSLFS